MIRMINAGGARSFIYSGRDMGSGDGVGCKQSRSAKTPAILIERDRWRLSDCPSHSFEFLTRVKDNRDIFHDVPLTIGCGRDDHPGIKTPRVGTYILCIRCVFCLERVTTDEKASKARKRQEPTISLRRVRGRSSLELVNS